MAAFASIVPAGVGALSRIKWQRAKCRQCAMLSSQSRSGAAMRIDATLLVAHPPQPFRADLQ